MRTRPYAEGEPKRGTWQWMKWRIDELERLNIAYRNTLESMARLRATRVDPTLLLESKDQQKYLPKSTLIWEDDSIKEAPDQSTWFHRVLGLLICIGVIVAFWFFAYVIYSLATGAYANYTKGVGK